MVALGAVAAAFEFCAVGFLFGASCAGCDDAGFLVVAVGAGH